MFVKPPWSLFMELSEKWMLILVCTQSLECFAISHIKHWSSLPNGPVWQLHKVKRSLFRRQSLVFCPLLCNSLISGLWWNCFFVDLFWLAGTLTVASSNLLELKMMILVTFGLGLFFFLHLNRQHLWWQLICQFISLVVLLADISSLPVLMQEFHELWMKNKHFLL